MSLLNSKEMESVVNLPGPERYSYFIKKVADSEKLWSLKNTSGWILAIDSSGCEIIPVWPHKEYANLCQNDEWRGSIPTEINLKDWLSKWIPGMIKDHRKVGVFPTILSQGVVVTPERLLADLNDELAKIE